MVGSELDASIGNCRESQNPVDAPQPPGSTLSQSREFHSTGKAFFCANSYTYDSCIASLFFHEYQMSKIDFMFYIVLESEM